MDLEEEIEECNHCGITIKINNVTNWDDGAFYCDSCFELLQEYNMPEF